ncbi:F-box protein CPR1-like [Silene latifolia]|uniref:F-box protein CPR1-like n=1 Tax=Silene latifolia TaxID=37657 RepID=UPI003D78A841
MTTTVLPLDVITVILLRLPAKTLLRFKSVCKAWYSLITDPNFARLHLQTSLATQTNLHFVIKTPKLHLADFHTFEYRTELNYPFKNYKHRGAEIVGSCRGLLCIWNMDRNLTLYLYNPTTQTHKMLPSLPINPPFNYDGMNFSFGFGYDMSSADYKCVRILQSWDNEKGGFESHVMVYSMKKDGWTKGPQVPYYFIYPKLCASALLDEAVHWLGESRERRHLPIVGFSLRDEEFRSIALPRGLNTELVGSMYLGVIDECLCLSVNYFNYYEVWVMEEYGVVETWVRRYTVQKGDGYDILERPICYSVDRKELFYRQVRLAVVSISMQTLETRPVQVAGFNVCWDAHPCVDNLLKLPKQAIDI